MADETARRRPSRALVALIDEVRWYAVQADAHAVPPRDLAFVALGCDLAELAASWRLAADEVSAKATDRAVAEQDVATVERRQVKLAGEARVWQQRVRGWARLVASGPELAARTAELLRVPRMRHATILVAEDTLRASIPRLAAAIALSPALDGAALIEEGQTLLTALNQAREARVAFDAEVGALPTAEESRVRLEALCTQAHRLWAQGARMGVGEVLPLARRREPSRRRATALGGDIAQAGRPIAQAEWGDAQDDRSSAQVGRSDAQDDGSLVQAECISAQGDRSLAQDGRTSTQVGRRGDR